MTGLDFRERILRLTGLSPTEVAKQLGISTQALASLTKSPDINSSYIEKSLDVFGLNVYDLLDCRRNDATNPIAQDNKAFGDMNLAFVERTQQIIVQQQEQFLEQQKLFDKLLAVLSNNKS